MLATDKQTGYPSVDKPWLKYYQDIDVEGPLFSGSLFDFFYEKNKDFPNDIALTYYGNKITYETFLKESIRYSEILQKIGVSRKSVISVLSIATPELLYLIYAANILGATINMIDPRYSIEHITDCIDSTDSDVVIVLDATLKDVYSAIEISKSAELVIVLRVGDYMAKIAGWMCKFRLKSYKKELEILKGKKQTVFIENLIYAKPIREKEHNDELNDVSFIFYTGGSTGKPKGVMLSDSQMNSAIEQYAQKYHWFSRQEKWLSITAFFFAYAWVVSFHMPLVMGMNCCLEMYNLKTLCRNIVKNKYCHIAINPGIYEQLLRTKHIRDLSFIKAPISGGESLSLALEKGINDFLINRKSEWKICQGYGMTETSSGISINYNNEIYKEGSVGIPFSHTIISAFDCENGDELKFGEVGEICVYGPSIMKGYYRNETETKQNLREHTDGRRWLHTGDLGYVDEDGFVFIVGRIKRMIVGKGGWKIYPQQVETILREVEGVDNIACVTVINPHDDSDEKAGVAIIKNMECKKSDCQLKAELEEFAETKLTEYMKPVKYIFLSEFPRTKVGKIDYKELEKMMNQ